MIRCAYTYVPLQEGSSETPFGNSLTVPDMTLSMSELVNRYTRSGQFGDIAMLEPIYYGDVEAPDFISMTPQEKLDYARKVKDSIADIRSKLTEQNKKAKEIEQEAQEQIVADDDAGETDTSESDG